jgi:hypothetical protein
MAMNGRDKRRAPRKAHNSVIEIFDVEGRVAASGRLIDYSNVGASFSVGDPVVMPDSFRARLRFLDKGVIEVEAKLVWTRRDRNVTRYGIAFDSVKLVRPPGAR